MQDNDIRLLLRPYLERVNKKFNNTIIVEELDLCSGLARIDIAVINGAIHGYEIKSEEDNLKRLSNQINYYNKALEKITVVTNKSHLDLIKKQIPKWWGLLLIKNSGKKNVISELRRAKTNPVLDSLSLLHVLWKQELISIADKYKLRVRHHCNKREIRDLIKNELDKSIISQEVRLALKSRQNWRSCSITTVR